MTNYNNIHNILASIAPPNPKSTRYWADLSEDPMGGILKSFKDGEWHIVNKQSLEIAEFAVDQIKLIDDKLTDLTVNAPEVLDTLKEISDALGGDPEFAANTTAKFELINTELEAIKAKNISQDEDIAAFNDSVNTINNTISSINSDIVTINSKISTNTASIESIKDDIETINSDITLVNSRVDDTNSRVIANENSISNINTSISNINNRIAELDNEIDINKTSINNINNSISAINDSINTINESISSTNNKISENTTKLNAIDTKVTELDSSFTTLSSSFNTLSESITVLSSKVDTNESNISDLTSRVTIVENNLTSISNRLNTAESDITILKNNISTINSSIDTINSSIETINTNIEGINTKITSIESSITTINESIDGIKSEIATIKSDIANNKLDITVINGNITTLLEHKNQVDATLETIDSDITTMKADIRTLRDTKADKESFAGDENTYAYGIAKYTGSTTPTFTRIGSMQLHKDLPIHKKLKGCTLSDDGVVNHYFNDDWTANEDGTEIIKDGSDGMVMVEIPEFYIKYIEGDSEGYMISEYPLEGYTKTEKVYVSAYEATVDRTDTSSLKLVSVVSTNVNFRGGNNNSALDDTEKSLLGKPASAISRPNLRTYARNRGNINWNLYDAYTHNLIWILYTIEYASTNSQLAVNNTLTSTGYKQGGLGDGVTTVSSSDWSNFNSSYPFIPCGTSDSLGNDTGEVSYTLPESWKAGSTVTVKVPRYRGIENPFGHIWKNVDGVIFDIKTDEDGGTSDIMVCYKPFYYADSLNDQYNNLGQLPRANGYASQVVNGTVFPISTSGGSTTTGMCDYFYTNVTSSSLRTCFLGGNAYDRTYAGLACVSSSDSGSRAHAYAGSRLVYRTVIE